MKRIPLKERLLPDYTKGEEIFNMVSHIVGGAVGVCAVVLCVIMAALHHNGYAIAGSIVYGTSMIVLYACSSIYHGLSPKLMAKKVFQVIDHCAIFILIAGTYTPICLTVLREYDPRLGWGIFGLVWGAALLGITLNAIDLEKYHRFSAFCYLLMGWSIVLAWKAAPYVASKGGLWLLFAGGIAYTVGSLFYYLLEKTRYMHSVFHLFVVAGSIFHFLYILLYII